MVSDFRGESLNMSILISAMYLPICVLAGLGSVAAASHLYAASYGGSVYSLAPTSQHGSTEISVLSESRDCGNSPSWLMLDRAHEVLYCLNEGIGSSNGSITSFKTHTNGSLATIERLITPSGPVMSAIYSAPDVHTHDFLAVAHYETSTVTTHLLDRSSGHMKYLQTFTYSMSSPGPNAARQDAPHPHGVVVDPTGRYVLVPDLGADLVRIFSINPRTGRLEPKSPFVASPGSGPRHGVFWTPKGSNSTTSNVYFYLTHELSNEVSGFRVSYTAQGISLHQIFNGSSFGNDTAPAGSKVAEIKLSPNNNHLVVSNRLDNTFGPKNDSIAVFSCADAVGKHFRNVQFLGLFPAYGSSPRHFDISGSPDMVALALEESQSVGIARWSKLGGTPASLVAKKKLNGNIPAAIWA
ncbi:Cytochrome cd1-nitrite reductase-like C-terminal heme d1 [Penicillium chermesinum]|uniref:Cytochrome cd1-nitrite reductase-like C-terminal heme d1 n=1 Tax=Penicillium chermesinum TaxID=63820 RepID=A0A9W9TT53_9EURO|nr:Cytochrome cd1-nitrite reductase-like C-terminal heme d1 [Penicillium chermesinum]KAJ5240247.1 Cytochrome cd1-nitrite reductase-like C-terminal heme d1 [Penicillium chermesinum]KAJ6167116.1 Cytochrome cd1-nitrite reductase-like C-terminal heme d1 [Penicillium chermesinum]